MARTPKNLKMGTITSTTLTVAYLAPTGFNTPVRVLTLTNNTDNSFYVDVFRNDGTTDFLYKRVSIPAGIGRPERVWVADGFIVNAGDSIKLQASTADSFNYFVDGTEASL